MDLSSDARAEKARLRRYFQHVRATMGADEHAKRSEQIVRRLKTLPEILNARCVHVYWPMIQRAEIDLRPLIAWLYAHKKQIVLPVVLEHSAADGATLAHRRYEGADALVRNRLGIDEPSHSDAVAVHELDVVIVPAMGVGRSGHRIGYGGGHYDRFMKSLSVPRICPIYRECLVEGIDAEPHDVPVDIIVTEDEVLRVH